MPDQIAEIFRRNDVSGCIAIRECVSGVSTVFNSKRVKARFRPASTFKILNALIALELEAVEPDEILQWDKSPTWNESQQRSLNLRSAFQTSAVWFFRILAKRIGTENYRRYLTACEYGNCECGGNADKFWVKGPLLISPIEQLAFIEKLKTRQLPFSSTNIDIVTDIMLIHSRPNHILRGKTGFIDETENYGWFVGWSEQQSGEYLFVTHLDIFDIEMLPKRQLVTEQVLSELI